MIVTLIEWHKIVQLIKRAAWTFTFDSKNRLKTYTHTDASNVRGNVWYDGKGRVWQRWNDDSSSSAWDENLKRWDGQGGLRGFNRLGRIYV